MLTDIACKAAACPADKARARFSDGAGLYLEVAKTGFKRWFWKFYFCGKEKRLALGGYPEIRLKDARIARDIFATDTLVMNSRQSDGVTRRRHLRSATMNSSGATSA